MEKEHRYHLTVTWTGNMGTGTSGYKGYERTHVVRTDQKADIECSSDPAFRGDKNKHNPEELLLASLSSCHMLWYLHLCADAGIIVLDYSDHAEGTMIELSNGSGKFKEVVLHPEVIVAKADMIKKANALHEAANKMCFIANSVNFKVKHAPKCKTGT